MKKYTYLTAPNKKDIAKRLWFQKTFSQKCNVISRGFLLLAIPTNLILFVFLLIIGKSGFNSESESYNLLLYLFVFAGIITSITFLVWFVGYAKKFINNLLLFCYKFVIEGTKPQSNKLSEVLMRQMARRYEELEDCRDMDEMTPDELDDEIERQEEDDEPQQWEPAKSEDLKMLFQKYIRNNTPNF